MRQSLTIARVAGIPVKLHWTIILLLCFAIGLVLRESGSLFQTVFFLSFFFLLFGCVLLHEFGHALMAKRYGISTKDIILSPIGGLARLEFIPNIAIQEFLIAIAGPAVNVIIAAISAILMFALGTEFQMDIETLVANPEPQGLLQFLFWMNITLFSFNLIPAFPMDGGRILRSLLSMRIGFNKATRVATAIGKILAVVIFVYAIFTQQFILSFISAFVFITAHQEFLNLKTKTLLDSTKAGEIALRSFTKVFEGDSCESLREVIKTTEEKSFLVFDTNDNIIGTLPELFLVESADDPDYQFASQLMSKNIKILREEVLLRKVYELMNSEGLGIVAVTDSDNNLVGTLDRYTFGEFLRNGTKNSWLQL